MATDERDPQPVLQPTPVEVSGVRDPGMQALITLAVSLGWNVLQKINQPAVITALNGIQRRIPTNTSIRISVFQQHLTAILVHGDEDREPTPELMDALIRKFRLSGEHARRLRLAVGESPQQHRERLANDKAAEHKRHPDEHLTQHIEVPEPEPEPEPASQITAPAVVSEGRHIVKREPYLAHSSHRSSDGTKVATTYVSDTSYQRTWSDGTIDFECVVCGKAFTTSRGVGGHKQIHIRAGEAQAMPASSRDRQRGPDDPNHEYRPYGPRDIDIKEARLMRRQLQAIREALGLEDTDLAAERDALAAELQTARERISVLEANLDALGDLIAGLRETK